MKNTFFLLPKVVIILLIVLIPNLLTAQDLSGKATYIVQSTFSITKQLEGNAKATENSDVKNIFSKVDEQSKNTDLIEYTLLFEQDKTLFFFNEEMESDGDNKFNIALITAKGMGEIYFDIRKDEIFHQKDIYGKKVIIKKTSKDYTWKLENETKNIGDMKCYKATTTQKVYRKNGKHKTKIVEAWYAPSISISSGPLGYAGLPGLILELKDGKSFVYKLNKITFDLKDISKIKKPKKGRIVSIEEYYELRRIASKRKRQ